MGKLLSNLKWLVGKGYTGHEHLPEFRLVNMQGRLYDPVLCRFLSPDPYVQEPDNSQDLNRYSYCFNNPLAYTDPSGLWIYEKGNYYTEDKNDIARLWNFLNGFGSGSFDASTIRGFAASEITTGQQFAFYRYGMEGLGGQKIDHYVYLTGFTVYRSLFGQFTVDKSSFNRMIAARNKFMDDFSGVGSGEGYLRSSNVLITFSDGADNKVYQKLCDYFEKILIIASSKGIKSINISCTTNHPSNPKSAHKVANGARALDISTINGVSVSESNPYVSTMQDIIKATPGYLENYGPLIINKISNGAVILAPWAREIPGGHYDHIHLSVPW